MRQSGLADLLPSLRAVWVGLSGGSMVMAPNVGEEPIRWKPPTGGDRALGLVDLLTHSTYVGDCLPLTRFGRLRWTGTAGGSGFASALC